MPIEIVEGDAAQANVAAQPAFVMLYGPPGSQKTTDAYRAFVGPDGRCSAFFIPFEENALKIIASRGWPAPSHPKDTIKTWTQFEETIAWLAQNRNRYSAVVLDGITPFAMNLYAQASAKGLKNKFDVPNIVRSCLFTMRDWLRALGLHTVLLAHELPPAVHDGVFYPGSFEIAPKTIMRVFFGQIDTVLRVGTLTTPGQPAVRVYYTGGSHWPAEQLGAMSQPPSDLGMWLAKNREGCIQTVVPADLASFLRGRQPPYPGL